MCSFSEAALVDYDEILTTLSETLKLNSVSRTLQGVTSFECIDNNQKIANGTLDAS